jgi:NhaP-type Na+/H+ or K+/H+ antiporter
MTLLAAGSADAFDSAVLVLGALLMGGALVSGVVHRSFLSLTAGFVLAGFLLGSGGLELVEFEARSPFVRDLAIVALIVILFRDGLEVEAEMLQRAWRPPLRKLVVAMPLTAVIVAAVTNALTNLSWTECFLLGALLSPTDPVLSSSVVTNPRVPRLVRHSLNLESGLNDGLALPAVLAFSAALRVGESDFVWWEFVLQDVTLGFAFGIGMAFIAARLMPRRRDLAEGIPDHQKSLYALGVAFATYGVTVGLPPEGNGLIAVFTAAITLGILRPDLRKTFEHRAQDLVEIVKLGVFVVFGALLTVGGLFGDGWTAVAIVAVTLLVARPVAIWIALAGAGLSTATKGFMAWFGPKGVATMTFSLLVLGDQIPGNERIFNIAALCVFASILAHGLTDTPGAEWIARRGEQPAPERPETPTPPAGGAPGETRSASASAAAGPPDGPAGT